MPAKQDTKAADDVKAPAAPETSEPAKAKTVRMRRNKAEADVHPDEVENWSRGGWSELFGDKE